MSDNKKVNSSIVFRLNSWHISRLFLQFLWINTVVTLLFSGALLYHAEYKMAGEAWKSAPTADLSPSTPRGIKVPYFFNKLLPETTQNAVRTFYTDMRYGSFWDKVRGLKYVMWIPKDGLYFSIEYNTGEILGIFLNLFIVLVVLELLYLFSSIGKGARAMRRALLPIEVLTETTRSINQAQGQKPSLQLRDLTGAIDNINATRLGLDKRISVSSDQKELKELAKAINGMLDRINEAYRSQIRFVSDASHELRTPIAVIQGYANLLDRWGKNDEKALEESIEAIKSEAENMKNLVEQLLFLARGDNDSMQLNIESFDIGALVSEVIRETVMIDPDHKFSSETEPDIFIDGDVQLVKQAIRIFVDNSIKYSPSGEDIKVTTRSDGNYAKITVQDNGIGISGENLPNVFDRFFRSDDSRTRKTGGTGLGFAIAKWIVDRHGGTVEILSRKDLGTRVTVSLVKSSESNAQKSESV
ncbi:MAG: Signal transduction histidine-protein kinase ArlS [Firmicutes bacterium ADurb.Bin193]|nr:MAG: Signal transduction histidine-protein kinase ArlS [Firmicutes bacterium ADurb.Bin193]